MNNWIKLIKREVGKNKYPSLGRIKIGKFLMFIVALPIGTSLLAPIAATMMIPIKPSLWAKDKFREFRIRRSLK